LRQKEETLRNREKLLRKEGVRHSERLEKHYHAQIAGDIHIPHNFDEAYDDENWEYWQKAMLDELDSLNKHDVWDIVERSKDVKTIKKVNEYSILKEIMKMEGLDIKRGL